MKPITKTQTITAVNLNMENVNILHLSDLHLKYDNDVDFSSFFGELEKCIKNIEKPIHIITITGDLVDKGNVSDFDNFLEKFIEPISKISKCPKENIFCVPGNHDAERDENILELRNKFDSDNCTDSCFKIKTKELRKATTRFEDFDEFDKKMHPLKPTTKGYGVSCVLVNNINVAVIKINSAIYSHDDGDYKKLGLSKIQLDTLVNQYKAIKKENNIGLSIALMHHPEDWLRQDEKEHMWEYFSSLDKLPIDLVLHGHIHESKIAGKIDLDTFVLSLVTGTTYENGNKKENTFNSCRFAFYEICIEKSEINGKLFITNNKGKFVPDTSSYNSVNNDGCFSVPYNNEAFKKAQCIKFPIPINEHILVENCDADMLDDMIKKFWDFEKACRRRLDAFSSVPKEEFEKNETAIIKDWFMNIASCARSCLFEESETDNVRAHFRIYENGEHIHFCATLGDRQITPIKWNNHTNLIFHAFDKKRSLVKSLNPSICFDTKGEWENFITVPIFDKYNGNEIPLYSFGISIKGNNKVLNQKLELLSFLRIEDLIDSIYASFRRKYLS